MNRWLDDIAAMTTESACVAVTVAGVRGSAPRETGAKMLVTPRETIGTIGGGQLEYECTRIAVEQLLRDGKTRLHRRFPLGASLGQCCGGVVEVLFEKIELPARDWLAALQAMHRERRPAVLVTPLAGNAPPALVTADGKSPSLPDEVLARADSMLAERHAAAVHDGYLLEPVVPSNFMVAVFGAGHVGAATVETLARLDCELRWIDSRRGVFPGVLPDNVTAVESAAPAAEVAAMPPGAFYLVMTHSHPLDFDITGRVLARGDAAYCGLIGSRSKRRRFEREMRRQGMGDASLGRLTCPIGVAGAGGRQPAEIAIAVAAELLRTRDAPAAAKRDNPRGVLRAVPGTPAV